MLLRFQNTSMGLRRLTSKNYRTTSKISKTMELMEELGTFYVAPYTMGKDSRPKLIDVESLKVQFKAFKYFAFKER